MLGVSRPFRPGPVYAIAVGGLMLSTAGATWLGFTQQPERLRREVVATADLTRTVRIAGAIWPAGRILASSKAVGRVSRVHVKPGDVVRKGAVVFELDRSRAKLEVARRQLNLERAGAGSTTLEARLARLEYEEAVAALNDLRVVAPVGGRVFQVSVRVGDAVSPTFGGPPAGVVIGKHGEWVVEAEIDEQDARDLKGGELAVVQLDSAEQTATMEAVISDAPVLRRGRTSGSGALYDLRADVRGQRHNVLPGSTARLTVETARHAGVAAVPIEAILRVDESDQVLIWTGAAWQPRGVVLGLSDERRVEVVNGLRAGDIIGVGPEDVMRDAFARQRVK